MRKRGLKSKIYNQKGYSLVGVLMGASVGLILFTFLGQQFNFMMQQSSYIDGKVFMSQSAMRMMVMQANADMWLTALRQSDYTSSVLASCIPEAGTTFSCPGHDEALEQDEYLQSLVPLAWTTPGFSSVPLVDITGRPVAGPVGDEVYYDKGGNLCDPDAHPCMYKSTGFMVRRERASNVNPAGIIFAMKLEHMSMSKGYLFQMRPVVGEIYLDKSLTATCPTGFSMVESATVERGCLQNVEAPYGAKNWTEAQTDCNIGYGGRLPTQEEFALGPSKSAIGSLTDDYEWTGSSSGWQKYSCGQGSVTTCQLSSGGVGRDFRCWVEL